MLEKIRQKCRSLWLHILVAVLILAIASVGSFQVARAKYDSEFRVIYSLDRRQNDQEIVKVINDADKYIYFAIYYFTKNNIAEALIRAKQRGLTVWGITDADASTDSNKEIFEKLRLAGVEIETQKHVDGIMHVKALVTDKVYVSGSYNWTVAATESNDEVLEIGTNDSVRNQYLSIIKKILLKNE